MSAPGWSRLIDGALDRTVVLGYAAPGLAVRRRLPGWPADPASDCLSGRHVAVTGASSGLGTATAAGAAALGAHVHLIVRDEGRGERTAQQLRQSHPGAHVTVWRCDVADLDDVRRFAAAIDATLSATGDGLDVLIHNAGLMPPERTESAQGHELSMAVHVLGPVLMTELLRERLSGGHVIFVTSGGMYAQKLRADDPDYQEGEYAPATAYARSKRMQVELVPWLAERWAAEHITVSVTHPGWADTPGVQSSLPGFRRLTRAILRDDAEGADTSVWLAAAAVPTGQLWHDRRQRPTHLLPTTRPSREQVDQAQRWLSATLGW